MLLSIVLFILLVLTVLLLRPSLATGSVLVGLGTLLLSLGEGGMWFIFLPTLAVLLVLNVESWRREYLVAPVYKLLRKAMPPMSSTEREALEAGTTGWDKSLFSGQPDWQVFAATHPPALSEREQAFLDNEVDTLCSMITEWDVHQRQDLSPEVWSYLREKGFFGLIIPEEFGGFGLSKACLLYTSDAADE